MRITTSMGWVLLALAACAPDDSCDDARFDEVGPYASGVTTLDVDGVLVEVWYPASLESTAGLAPRRVRHAGYALADTRATIPSDAPTTFATDAYRDVPVASGSFPVVYLATASAASASSRPRSPRTSHVGATSSSRPSTRSEILEAAPCDARRRRDHGRSRRPGSPRRTPACRPRTRPAASSAGALDLSRVAIGGHLAGGAVQVLVDDGALGVTSWFGLATVAAPPARPRRVMLGGTVDTLATEQAMTDLWTNRATASTGAFVEIANAGHLAFTDICLIGRERGRCPSRSRKTPDSCSTT
ncbi:MAG: hypothetical protein R3B99_09755 [Polyangiales bacterium]